MVTRGRGAGMRPRETFSCFSYSFSIRFLRLSFFFSLSVKKNGMVMVLHASICSFLRGTGCYMKCVIRPMCKSLSECANLGKINVESSPKRFSHQLVLWPVSDFWPPWLRETKQPPMCIQLTPMQNYVLPGSPLKKGKTCN